MTYLNSPNARRAAMLACVSTVALGLTACKVDNRPLLARNGPEPTYVNSALPAPGPLDLAYAPAVQVRAFEEPYEAYSLAERAYGMDRAFYQAEPDYGFDYGEVEPWGWQSGDDWTMYAEPIDDGYRFYYYEPEAEHPYFVRDDRYGYGYDDSGALVALFTLAGALLPQSYLYDNADVAGRYYYRGEDMRRTARRERRMPVQDTYWRERAPVLVAAQTPWIQAADQQQDWRTYRTRTEGRDLRRFEPERARRAPRVDRAIEPDRRTLAAMAEAQSRPARDVRQEERPGRREARNELPQERAFQQQARLEQRQSERVRDDSQRQARDQARQAERQQQQQQQVQREQAENGRREQQANQARDQAREGQRQQREQSRQAENGRRQEVARAAQEQRGRADRERQRGEQQARQAEQQQRGAERQTARNAERQGRQAAAQEQQRPQQQPQQQAQGRPDGGRGGGGDDRGHGGGGNGKGGGKKD